MPTRYLDTWTELKTTFEHDAGAKIAAIEKKQAKQKVSGLREKDGVVRLKKPAEKGFLGTRKSSGMESACKALDKATAADVDMKTRTKALTTYKTAEGNYIEVLLKAAKEEPYSLVTKEIDALRKGMQKIAKDFNTTYCQRETRAAKSVAESIKALIALKKELSASNATLAKVNLEKATASEIKTLKTDLKTLRDDTVTRLVGVYDDRGYNPQTAHVFAESIHLFLKRLSLDKKSVGGKSSKEEALSLFQGRDAKAIFGVILKQGKNVVSDCDDCINLCGLI
jgi:hypothetical protein